jgi:hypothetical protein
MSARFQRKPVLLVNGEMKGYDYFEINASAIAEDGRVGGWRLTVDGGAPLPVEILADIRPLAVAVATVT